MLSNVIGTSGRKAADQAGVLIVVPCLNEAEHIRQLLDQLCQSKGRIKAKIVVVDGGSTDGTLEIVQQLIDANDDIVLLHNPAKIQSAAMNLAVEKHGDCAKFLIRIDAHSTYPDDYCDVILGQAKSVYADSIVVSMAAQGQTWLQRVIAAAQNSKVGNGGAKHRNRPAGGYVDHGHHALMTIAAFKAVGGYDTSFSHNEDAELDFRLIAAGYRIWLTNKTLVTYHPRKSFFALARQYFNFGKGRAQNLHKHKVIPHLRQAKVMIVAPAIALAALAQFHWVFLLPALFWAAYCVVIGTMIAVQARDAKLVLTCISAMLMHLAWSLGFWHKLVVSFVKARPQVAS